MAKKISSIGNKFDDETNIKKQRPVGKGIHEITVAPDEYRCQGRSRRLQREHPLGKEAPYEEVRCSQFSVRGSKFCRMHGANRSRPVKNGQFTKRTSERLTHLYEKYVNDKNLNNLDHDVALLRTMIALQLEKIDSVEMNGDGGDAIAIEQVRELLKDVRNTIKLKEELISMFNAIPLENVQAFVNSIISILQKYIKEEDQLKSIVGDISALKIITDGKVVKPKRRLL